MFFFGLNEKKSVCMKSDFMAILYRRFSAFLIHIYIRVYLNIR